jgi:type I restriction enzyme, S subunit
VPRRHHIHIFNARMKRYLKISMQITELFSTFVSLEIDDKSTGSTKQTELNFSVVKNYPLLLPPLNEQKRIVEKVEQLMALCDQLESSI